MKSTFASFFKFVLQSLFFFILIPILIDIVLFIYARFAFGSILEYRKLSLVDVGFQYTIILYQSFLTPILIPIFRKVKWVYAEFWSIFYLTQYPIHYLVDGKIFSEPGDVIDSDKLMWSFLIISIFYYEFFYETYLIKKWLRINPIYNIKTLLNNILRKKNEN